MRKAPQNRSRRTSWICCLLWASAVSHGEVIDRVAVTVDQQVITLSRVREEISIAAFLDGVKPDFSAAARKQAADRLVERLLIEREMALTRFPAAPPEEAARRREQIRGGRSETQFRQALAAYEITEETLRQYLARQAALLHFIEVRFRPEIQVGEEEVRECLQKRGSKAAGASEDARAQCEEWLAAAAVDQAVDRWLREARERPRIVYREEAFQ